MAKKGSQIDQASTAPREKALAGVGRREIDRENVAPRETGAFDRGDEEVVRARALGDRDFLPLRSATDWNGESFGTTTACPSPRAGIAPT